MYSMDDSLEVRHSLIWQHSFLAHLQMVIRLFMHMQAYKTEQSWVYVNVRNHLKLNNSSAFLIHSALTIVSYVYSFTQKHRCIEERCPPLSDAFAYLHCTLKRHRKDTLTVWRLM